MAGVAELKAGPTQEQQNHARVLRERLLVDLQQQVTLYRPCNILVQDSSHSAPCLTALCMATGAQQTSGASIRQNNRASSRPCSIVACSVRLYSAELAHSSLLPCCAVQHSCIAHARP